MTLKDLEPYLTAVGAVVSVASLGFLLNMLRQIQEIGRERAAAIKDRLEGAKEDLERTEKWGNREQERLRSELNRLQTDLNAALSKEGLGLEALAVGRDLRDAADVARTQIRSLVDEMQQRLTEFRGQQSPVEPGQASWSLVLAKGEMASGDASAAAALFDEYSSQTGQDWGVHFLRGVAHANAGKGRDSNVAALRAYNEALALAPENLGENTRARVYTYRGAILKRLKRLSEAEADLTHALLLAKTGGEKNDAFYNLAGVYALQSDRVRMLDCVNRLGSSEQYKAAIRAHLRDYFAMYAKDPELLRAIGLSA
jgi:Flp pilus assembly protein TadD